MLHDKNDLTIQHLTIQHCKSLFKILTAAALANKSKEPTHKITMTCGHLFSCTGCSLKETVMDD